ncbi:MAG: adenylate/guanylate cyclase domain-containing protein [Alphaproteobacteria bacterium]|nr:adenylate/guanylate cyclase domain-containing protein [Alphaproteobacteria bacterium]
MERRLAAILAADVVGYSRLTEADEEATVRALHTCRQAIEQLVAAHHGRVFGSAGDSMVAEFLSPVEAVRCAVDIQRALEADNVDLPEDRRMRLRIGINLGDVIVEGDNLLGDGVNIAARLEALADPGGICLSRPVVDQIKKQLDLGYEYLGEHEVKNIAEPVPVYRVLTEPDAAGTIIDETRRVKHARKRLALLAAAVVLIGLAAVVSWLRPWEPTVEPASVAKMAFPLPDKPSIAVLPFDNLSGDAGQDHVPDGLTEDIITALSQLSSLFVIARNSTFVYKDKPVKVQQVAEDLGVRYVLEGSVQKSGDQVRIAAQLVDALAGNHLWAERYDRKMTDLFALQDEITEHIVTALQIKLTAGEQMRVHRKHTRNLEAWNLLSQGVERFYRSSKTDNAIARQWFERAVEVDPEYALAYAFLAWSYWQEAFQGWAENRELALERAWVLAEKARTLDDALPDVYALQGALHLLKREYDEAIEAGEKAVAYNPNHATNTALLAMILHYAGRPEEAIRRFKAAMRLSPYYSAWFLEVLGFAYLGAKQPDEALVAFEEFLARRASGAHASHARIGRALAYHALGQDDEARAEVVKALEADAAISVAEFRQLSLNKDRAGLERGLAILRRLGLPE